MGNLVGRPFTDFKIRGVDVSSCTASSFEVGNLSLSPSCSSKSGTLFIPLLDTNMTSAVLEIEFSIHIQDDPDVQIPGNVNIQGTTYRSFSNHEIFSKSVPIQSDDSRSVFSFASRYMMISLSFMSGRSVYIGEGGHEYYVFPSWITVTKVSVGGTSDGGPGPRGSHERPKVPVGSGVFGFIPGEMT